MGSGPVDIVRWVWWCRLTCSSTFTSATLLAGFDAVYANAWVLFEKMQIVPEDVRGIGLTLKELRSVVVVVMGSEV